MADRRALHSARRDVIDATHSEFAVVDFYLDVG